MKMIDVLNMMAEGNLKEGTILKFVDSCNEIVSYIYDEEMNAFYDEAQYDLGSEGEICGPFLNKKVELIPPKPKKYQLKLYIGDITSYVTRSYYDNDFNYDLGSKYEVGKFKKKFTQAEIDNDKFLKFVEQHGIKEEVAENEID